MKLIECYIENFGRLSAHTHTFSDGLNVIIGKNGCGKTTLSVFIKSMLYGLETKKTKGEESDRKRYFPWQGGRFGGSLTFENEGKRYRIERTFGEKQSGDSFAIYNAETGAASSDFSENVGEELFDIDADGFERTVFLSERKFSVSGNNQTVSAKLSNLVGVDGDMGSFDSAIDELEKKEKYYRHRRGKGGIIGDIKSDVSALDAEIIDIARKKDSRREAEEELIGLRDKINDAEKRKSLLEEKRLSDTYRKEYQSKRDTLASYEERLEREKRFFNYLPPSSEEIRHYEQKHSRVGLLKETLKQSKEIVERAFEDNSSEIEKHISMINNIKNRKNVNKTYHYHSFLALIFAILAIALGLAIHPALYCLSFISVPFVYLAVSNLKKTGESKNCENDIEETLRFLSIDNKDTAPDLSEIHSVLFNMKASVLAEKTERERALRSIKETEESIKALTDECETFLSRFNFEGGDRFRELRAHLTSYESLREQISLWAHETEKYANEKGIKTSEQPSEKLVLSTDDIPALDAEIRSLRSLYYSLESRISALDEEISREDELKERRLELTDALLEAEASHKITIKAAEHLALAKERLTSKYLGKMREAFNFYIDAIGGEDAKNFTMDTDFSLKKTENGLTNPISSYSLGTKELYSLSSRLALVDALYEKNYPFIVLDDPFSHFDDKRCKAALEAVKKISAKKQIIYLTCSEARTPN